MTVEDLQEMAEKEQAHQQQVKHRILYCSAAGCVSCGSHGTRDALAKAIKDAGLEKECEVLGTGCMGLCGEGPLVKVQSDDTLYQQVDGAVARRIVEEHIVGGKKVRENLIDQSAPFFASQVKIVLENCGRIDAESIEEYIAAGGYDALAKVVTEMQPQEVIDEIRKSGLRGARRRGVFNGPEMGDRSEVEERSEIRCLQRRRRRPRCVHGPERTRGGSPPHSRRDGHRRLRGRRQSGVCLHQG